MEPLYPLKFHPILQEKIWGGDKLKTVLHKDTDQTNIGESWELSAVDSQCNKGTGPLLADAETDIWTHPTRIDAIQ